jgi:site-specific recombinase XerD
MGKLVSEYNKNLRVYLRKKSDTSKKSENQRKNKIIVFLKHCEKQNVESIKNINETHYRSFVSEYLVDKSTETRRKYLLSLREFFTRAHINIKINVQNNINRTKEKKLSKILNVLNINDNDINQQQKEAILKLL